MDNLETFPSEVDSFVLYKDFLDIASINLILSNEGGKSDELPILVHLIEDHLCSIAENRYRDFVETGWIPNVDYMDLYLGYVTILFPKEERYLLSLIQNPLPHESTNTRDHLLSMTIKELHSFEKQHNLNRKIRLALEAVWGTERSARAIELHRLGPVFILGDDKSVEDTIMALSDYHFIQFCNLPMKPAFVEYLNRQEFFRQKLERVRNRYKVYKEKELIVTTGDLFGSFSSEN